MRDYTDELPPHTERYVGEHDLYLEIYKGEEAREGQEQEDKAPLLFVHGAYTGEAGCGASTFPTSSAKAGPVM